MFSWASAELVQHPYQRRGSKRSGFFSVLLFFFLIVIYKANHVKGQDRPIYHHFLNAYTHLCNVGFFCCLFLLVSSAAFGGSRREEDQISCGSAGGNPDEEAGDKAAAFWGAGDHHGPWEGGREWPFFSRKLFFLIAGVIDLIADLSGIIVCVCVCGCASCSWSSRGSNSWQKDTHSTRSSWNRQRWRSASKGSSRASQDIQRHTQVWQCTYRNTHQIFVSGGIRWNLNVSNLNESWFWICRILFASYFLKF